MTRLVNTLCMTRPNRKMNLGIAGAITYERIKNQNCVECQISKNFTSSMVFL